MSLPHFSKAFDLVDIPNDWRLVSLSADWHGRPLLLFVEAKPPQPDIQRDLQAWSRWYRTPPKAHHVVYQEAGQFRSVAFDRSQGISTFHVQRFESGWLLGESRGGHASFHDASGALRFPVELGDAIESIQTTTDGRIWVSYFDEGVFGGGIGRQGLVCFDSSGRDLFKYGDFAEQNDLPMICDCYALNVDSIGDVWLNYYTDFPLVRFGRGAKGNRINDALVVPAYHQSAQLISFQVGEALFNGLTPIPYCRYQGRNHLFVVVPAPFSVRNAIRLKIS